MMTKIISPAGWDYGDATVRLMKMGSLGMGPNDRSVFMKRASHLFLPLLDDGRVKFAEDEEPVHLLAMGATEAWGPNRNGDGFKEAVCKHYHDTFEKFARFYRNHANKNPAISYGVVKAAAYNPIMRRIELLCALNRTKSAAERNGGFVADQELEKLGRGDDLAVSMACTVPHDVCSWCGNKARTRDEYCKEASCGAGGCDKNLTKLLKVAGQTHLLHVDNTEPRFFDISKVWKPADRTAYGNRADWLTKAAGDGGQFGIDGAKMASDMGVMAPLAVLLDHLADQPGLVEQIKLAHALADCEQLENFQPPPAMKLAFVPAVQPPLDLAALGLDSDIEKAAGAVTALTDVGAILPLREFARVTKRAHVSDEAAGGLRGVCRRMIDDSSLQERLVGNRFAAGEKRASFNQGVEAWKVEATYSVIPEVAMRRCQRAGLRGQQIPTEKRASSELSPAAEALARDYACYKIAALCRMAKNGCDVGAVVKTTFAQDQAA